MSPRPRPTPIVSRLVLLATVSLLSACGPSPATPGPEAAATDATAGAVGETEASGEAAPVLAADEPVYEFGRVAPGETVTHVFTIHNRGTADLHIERVERT